MIRRAFWLVAGAVLGVAGYRRLSRTARVLASGAHRTTPAPALRAVTRAGRDSRAFVRDFRAGMAEYLDRHPGRPGNTLVGQRARASVRQTGSDNSKDGR